MKPAWTGFLLSISLCLDLGIVNVAVLQAVLRRGGMAGFLIGLGSSFGDLVYFALATSGAAQLFNDGFARRVLWICGTAALLFLSWRMIREAIHPHEPKLDKAKVETSASGKLFMTGIGLALASPSAILWFAAVGRSVIASFGNTRSSLLPFAAGFFIGGVAWSALFAFALARMKRVIGATLSRALAVISAFVFLYLAGSVFFRGLREVI